MKLATGKVNLETYLHDRKAKLGLYQRMASELGAKFSLLVVRSTEDGMVELTGVLLGDDEDQVESIKKLRVNGAMVALMSSTEVFTPVCGKCGWALHAPKPCHNVEED